MAIELLQHALERFGVVTVMDAYLFDIATGKPTMYLDSLKMSNITTETQEKQVKGGRFADIRLVYNYGRTMNIEFQDALLSMSSMKELWGAQIERIAANITQHNDVVITVAAGSVTLPIAAKAILGVYDVALGTELELGTVSPATTKYYWVVGTPTTVTFNTDMNSKQVRIFYTSAAVDTGLDPVQALIKSSSFPKTVKFVGRTFFIEEATGRQMEVEIEIPKLKLNSNFTLTLEAEGDASVFDFSGMALTAADQDLIKFKTLKYLD